MQIVINVEHNDETWEVERFTRIADAIAFLELVEQENNETT